MSPIRLCATGFLFAALGTSCQAPGVPGKRTQPPAAGPTPVEVVAQHEIVLFEEESTTTLAPTERTLRIVDLEDSEGSATYRYRVKVRGVGVVPARLRLQAMWMPEGGWDARDSEGESLVTVFATHVAPGSTTSDTFELEMTRPEIAVELRVLLQNEGDAPIEVTHMAVLEQETQPLPSSVAG